MLQADAIELIENEQFRKPGIQIWADLGCGSGLFTTALSSRLTSGSIIYAVDIDAASLRSIPNTVGISIKPVQSDFVNDRLNLPALDGILMANSLHYVKDKTAFISKITKFLQPDGVFLIIEYDTDRPVTTWVPYPVSFQSLTKLLAMAGFTSAVRIGQRPSRYNRGTMYCALIKK
jgi:ubiquinone/menaquinone biosynthesis C-methylase UbiE